MENNMSESIQHYELVQKLLSEIKKEIPEDKWILIQTDSFCSKSIPPKFGDGSRPDVYYEFENIMIVGEAKISKDVTSERSQRQYRSFLYSCSIYTGKAMLFLAVPFDEYVIASNAINKIKKEFEGSYEVRIVRCNI